MKKSLKIMVILLAIMLVFAVVATPMVMGNLADPRDVEATEIDGADGLRTIGGQILGVVQIIGSVVAVVILVVLGIKYMMGSAEEKAEYKKTMMPYIIGAIFIFGASSIAMMVYNWASNL